MRKGFKFIKESDAVTKVTDKVSAFVPDQSISLRDMMMQFAYIGNERLEQLVNRGYDGDEDEDVLGVPIGSLDLAEIHDRILDLQKDQNPVRSIHAPQPEPEPEPEPEPADEK